MKFKKNIKSLLKSVLKPKSSATKTYNPIEAYKSNGMIPWSEGYVTYKESEISNSINDGALIEQMKLKTLPSGYGLKLDERIVEYLWIWSHLNFKDSKILDAGSTLNFKFTVENSVVKENDLFIYTFAPEKNSFSKNGISYVYGDLREIPFKRNLFDCIISQSTIEHIGMDNSIYGYDIPDDEKSIQKSYEYMKVVTEMIRVLKPGGLMMITFPYGKFENHGFFQQFDKEMLDKIRIELDKSGVTEYDYFKYEKTGWSFANQDELFDYQSYNPHTGEGKGTDGAAHCRSVCCIKFIKSND
jgi:SAM-dependent methyltransferase